MGYPFTIALRYLGSKKRSFISIGTLFAMLGVTLGVAALTIVMSVTGGFQEQFREKVLGVNAHVLVLKYSIDFREYREVMAKVRNIPGITGVAPFVINPMMVTHGDRTATGVLLKGVDPDLMGSVLDLPKHIVEGSLEGLRKPDSKAPDRPQSSRDDNRPKSGDKDPATAPSNAPNPSRSLLQAIEQEIAKDDAAARAGASPKKLPDSDGDSSANAAKRPLKDIPVGEVTPAGGFASTLPDIDVLPADVDPDPCTSPSGVKRLPGVVVGKSLAKQLDLHLGNCVQITSPTIGIAFGASSRSPVAKQFRVIAIFEAGFDQYDSKLVYTDLYEAQAFYDYGDSVTGVEMKLEDIDNARATAKAIDQLLSNGIYHTMDWKELNHGLFMALLIQKIGMSAVLALMIVVAAFTVIATLIMMVLDKKREIAILKALGARNDAVLRMFLYQGAIIGTMGTVLGVALGYLGCRGLLAYGFRLDPKVYFISKLPVNIRPIEFVLAGSFAMVVCLAATLFPALYAAKLRPAEGLRAD